ncbi:hypothetical protein NESM_000300500 [Novymonas esmeraldas]|uniref:Dienelactone hydrolase domain-containing protein n=1 Tax=Novymonas esmeraldas TaxID=1808958 RepID=A0AAW0F7S6_9TRYP
MSSEHPNRCCPTDKGAAKCHYDPTGDDFYVVGPYDAKAGIVVVGDLFGMLPNSKHFVDFFAQHGYLVVMPDFFGAKAWPADDWPIDYTSAKFADFNVFARNFDNHKPRMERAIALLRRMGCVKVGSVGLCWGSALTFMMAAEGKIDAAAQAHSFLFTDEHVKAAKTPVLVMPSKDEPPMDEVEAAVKAHPIEPHVYRRFSTLSHGFFGGRYDPDTYTVEEMTEVEEARQLALRFFNEALL